MNRTPIPASFFSIAVGLLALANAWHVATPLWALPHWLADTLTALALGVWAVVTMAYAHKWWRQRAAALAELQHPLQSSFAALGPVSTLLAAIALRPWQPTLALTLFGLAVVAQLALGLWLYGRFWQGGRALDGLTAAAYLPVVAQNFVAATASAAFGWPQWGLLFFGAGLFVWLALESLVLARALTQPPMPEAQRPLLGVQLAPPVVGGVSYLALTAGPPDLFVQLLFGYGLYQALLLLRLLPWIARQPFTPSYWAFSFGVAALPTVALRLVERGAGGPAAVLALPLFVAANLAIGWLLLRTTLLGLRGQLLPPPPQPAAG